MKWDRLYSVMMLAAVVLAVSSCSSRRVTATPAGRGYERVASGKPTGGGVRHRPIVDRSMAEATRRLLSEAESWMGTGYRYGGNDRDGVDCSGFVTQVYKNSLDISLPRQSMQQMAYCDSIGRDELRAGDLVFFGTRGSAGVGHVGIYIGGGDMIHASTSRGVTVSSIESPYYVNNYKGCGRVGRYAAMLATGGDRKQLTAEPTKAAATAAVAKRESGVSVTSVAEKPAGGGALTVTAGVSDGGDEVGVIEDFFD